ncbi:hypothetical protein Cantr_10175 [Candida viswanathii]|uniref:Uncharacterized protein n=1 Tax=Candida viswanathii TaxID=5486 RepID=A0A367YAX0_9ASCO|nr:hypothetical protein Cantr_10175 [Candida viswanathii]
MTSTEMKKSPTHLGREQEWSRLSAPEELTSPLLMGHDLSDVASSELPQFPVSGGRHLCREPQPDQKEQIQGRREFEPSRLSATEQLAPPFRVHHDPSDAASSELPRVAVIRFCVESEGQSREQEWSRLSAPEQLTSPLLMGHDLSDVASSELPQFPVSGGRHLCREPQPDQKEQIQGRREFEPSRLSAPEQLAPPFRVHHDPSDAASSELPQVSVIHFCVDSGGRHLCREPQPDQKEQIQGRREFEPSRLSATEQLAPPFRVHHDPSDAASSELPRVAVIRFCVESEGQSREQEWSRLSAPEQLTSPLLMGHDLSDVASSELPQFPVWGHCVGNYSQITNRRCRRNDHLISGGRHLCREPQPDQKEQIQGRREFEPSRLSATEQLAPPFRVHHDPSDAASSELPRVAVIRFCVESEGQSREQEWSRLSAPEQLTSPLLMGHDLSDVASSELPQFPVSGGRHLCREPQPDQKEQIQGRREFEPSRLSATEQLAPPFRVHHDPSDAASSELPQVSVIHFCVDSGGRHLCREPQPDQKEQIQGRREFEPSRLSAPEQLAPPFRVHHDPSDAASSELPRVAVIRFCVESEGQSREQEWSRLSAPEQLTSPLLMGHDLSDVASSELPQFPVSGGRHLCREPQPDQKEQIQGRREFEPSRLSATEQLAPPFRVHHDPSDAASSELPRVAVIRFCVESEGQSREQEWSRLSAPEQLTSPLLMGHDLSDVASSELPQFPVSGGRHLCREPQPDQKEQIQGRREFEPSRLSAPEQLAPPFRVHHDPSDAASSELPQVSVIHFCVDSGGRHLCREPQPDQKEQIQGRREFEPSRLSAPEQLAPPFRVHHDPSDAASSELPRVAVIRFCVESEGQSREQEWSRLSAPEQLTSPLLMGHDLSDVASSELPQFPVWGHCVGNYSQITNRRCRRNDHLISGGRHLCREPQPDQKEQIQGRREFEPSRLSAPEQLAPPFRVHHDPSDAASSELPQVSVIHFCVDSGGRHLCREPQPDQKEQIQGRREFEPSRLSAPEQLAPPFRVHHDPSDAASSELPRVPVRALCVENYTLFKKQTIRRGPAQELPGFGASGKISLPLMVDSCIRGPNLLYIPFVWSMTSTEMKKSPTHLGREQEWSRLSAPEELTSPLLMGHDLSDVASSELPQFPVSGGRHLCREPQPDQKEQIQGRREFEPSRLSATEQLAPPFRVHHDPSDAASSELPRVAVIRFCVESEGQSREQEWSRLSAPEQLTSPLLMGHDLSDVASSELPQFPVSGGRHLCREPQPDQKEQIQGRREFEPSRLSATEQLAPPFRVHHDPSDAASSELPRVAVIRFCVESEGQSREQEWSRLSAPEQLTSPLLMGHDLSDVASSELPQFPVWGHCVGNYSQITNRRCRRNDHLISGGRHLCREPQPDQKEQIQGRREFEPSRLSATEQLAPPFRVHHDPSDAASSELPRVAVIRFCVESEGQSREQEWSRLSAPEQLTSPLLMGHDLSDVASSELPQFPVWGHCVGNYSQITNRRCRRNDHLMCLD